MRLGRGVWQCITGGEVLVDLLTDCLELALFELGDADAAPAFGGADQCRIDQLQDGALAEGMRDHFGAPPAPRQTAAPTGWWCESPGGGRAGNAVARCRPRNHPRGRPPRSADRARRSS